ncbi:hypothetical protein TIFTF001_038778, partial [Ficus carica]
MKGCTPYIAGIGELDLCTSRRIKRAPVYGRSFAPTRRGNSIMQISYLVSEERCMHLLLSENKFQCCNIQTQNLNRIQQDLPRK